jgi:hypothetical protein
MELHVHIFFTRSYTRYPCKLRNFIYYAYKSCKYLPPKTRYVAARVDGSTVDSRTSLTPTPGPN